ncbi:MAG: MBL fold metallo-hydrolase, partial [Lysobacteraceae bacterium]
GDGMTVSAFAVHHGSWDHAYGYTFQTAGRRIVVSGDTTPMAEIVAQCHGCDVLVHEVYSVAGFKR